MNYSIGEFAALMGVTMDTLRLYEKHNIIKPIKDDRNHYRYFNDLDARALLQSRLYRSMEIPLSDVAALIGNSSLRDLIEQTEKTQLKLEEEIRRKSRLLRRLQEITADYKRAEASINQCQIKNMPGIYRIRQTEQNNLLHNGLLKNSVSQWMDKLPYAFRSFVITSQEFLAQKMNLSHSWGLALSERDFHDFGMEMSENVEYYGPKTCVSSIILSPPREELLGRDALQIMTDYLKENNHAIAGDIIGKLILSESGADKNKSYLEINIPI